MRTVTAKHRIVKPYPDENYDRSDVSHRSVCVVTPTELGAARLKRASVR